MQGSLFPPLGEQQPICSGPTSLFLTQCLPECQREERRMGLDVHLQCMSAGGGCLGMLVPNIAATGVFWIGCNKDS